jgi:hypothetical protein
MASLAGGFLTQRASPAIELETFPGLEVAGGCNRFGRGHTGAGILLLDLRAKRAPAQR